MVCVFIRAPDRGSAAGKPAIRGAGAAARFAARVGYLVRKLACMKTLLLAVVGACSAGGPAQKPPASESASKEVSAACDARLLTDEGIGALRIGMSVDSIRTVCRVLRDTVVTDMEGMPSRRLTIGTGPDSVEAEIVENKLWRLSVYAPRFQSADSLGVGTSIARFKAIAGARAMRGEGAVYAAIPAHCGMSFQLTGFKPAAGAVVLQTLPPSVTVLRVLIFGCRAAPHSTG